MATPLAVNDIFLVTAVGTIHGQRTMNTFHYRLSEVTGGLVEDAYIAFEDKLAAVDGLMPRLRACCPMNWTLTEWWVQRVSPQRVIKYVSTEGTGPGIQASSTVTNVQASIERRGELATRSAIGALRVCISPTDALAGNLTVGQKAQMDALATTMSQAVLLDFIGVALPVLWSPPKGTPPIATLHDIYQCITKDTTRVIRRRTVGLGI